MQAVEKLEDRNAHEPIRFADAMPATLDRMEGYMIAARSNERWPRTRFGKREPVPSWVRRLVFERDGGCCLSCGMPLTIRTAQLDHIVPWSAGGSDCSHNLRILCEPCNVARSNFRTGLDDHAARRPHVTWGCVACFHLQDGGEPFPVVPGMMPAYCGQCGMVSLTCPETVS